MLTSLNKDRKGEFDLMNEREIIEWRFILKYLREKNRMIKQKNDNRKFWSIYNKNLSFGHISYSLDKES